MFRSWHLTLLRALCFFCVQPAALPAGPTRSLLRNTPSTSELQKPRFSPTSIATESSIWSRVSTGMRRRAGPSTASGRSSTPTTTSTIYRRCPLMWMGTAMWTWSPQDGLARSWRGGGIPGERAECGKSIPSQPGHRSSFPFWLILITTVRPKRFCRSSETIVRLPGTSGINTAEWWSTLSATTAMGMGLVWAM